MMSHTIPRARISLWVILPAVSVIVGMLSFVLGMSTGATQMREHLTRRPHVSVDVSTLPNADCQFIIGQQDDDGRPGGSKSLRTFTDCP